MASINIPTSEQEHYQVIQAVMHLNNLRHVKYMSHAGLAETAGLKATKVRLVLKDLIDAGLLTQYQVSKNKRVQRYYYVLTPMGWHYLWGIEDSMSLENPEEEKNGY